MPKYSIDPLNSDNYDTWKRNHKICSNCWKTNNKKKPSPKACDSAFLCLYAEEPNSEQSPYAEECLLSEECFLSSDNNDVDDRWVLDSGCTSHMTFHSEYFQNMKKTSRKLQFASKNFSSDIEGEGRVTLSSENRKIHLENALYVPDLCKNLLSLSRMTKNGARATFYDNVGLVYNKNGILLMIAEKSDKNGLYYIKSLKAEECNAAIDDIITPSTQPQTIKQNSIQNWHRKLGHMNEKDLHLALNNERMIGLDFNKNETLPEYIPSQVPPLTPGTNKKMAEALKATFASWEKEQLRLGVPKDPRQWSEAAVAAWLRWAAREFSLEGVALQQFARAQGKDICAMGREEFVARAPAFMGDILWEHLEILQKVKCCLSCEISLEGVALQQFARAQGKDICAMGREEFVARAPAFMGDILWEHLEILQKDVEKERSLLANVPPNMYESNVCLPELSDYSIPPPAHHYNNNNTGRYCLPELIDYSIPPPAHHYNNNNTELSDYSIPPPAHHFNNNNTEIVIGVDESVTTEHTALLRSNVIRVEILPARDERLQDPAASPPIQKQHYCNNKHTITKFVLGNSNSSLEVCHYIVPKVGIEILLQNIEKKISAYTLNDFCVVMIGDADFKTSLNCDVLIDCIRKRLEKLKNTNIIIVGPEYKLGAAYYNSRVSSFNNGLKDSIVKHKYGYFYDINSDLTLEMYSNTTKTLKNKGMRVIIQNLLKYISHQQFTRGTKLSQKHDVPIGGPSIVWDTESTYESMDPCDNKTQQMIEGQRKREAVFLL
ncbi:sterile alpha motif (SAM)/Pointed domain-containing protein [Phthorimaea operculella]|nr:sterile alpha motif (SAM)/Pointed domain-containing protein [Phthorimaea operculella]